MAATRVLIIGAGPIGLETAACLQRAGVDVSCLDAGPVGRTIHDLFPPGTRFFSSPERLSIAGFDLPVTMQEKPTREEYLAYLRSVVASLDLSVHLHETVIGATPQPGGWSVHTQGRSGLERMHEASHVVLAIGGTHLPRQLGIPGEDLPHVDHDLGDPHRFFRRRVVIVGGRNSAAESALRCWRVGASVTLVHRGEALHERVKYWIRPELQSLIEEGLVQAHFNTRLTAVSPEGVELEHIASGDRSMQTCDDILLMVGYEQAPTMLDLFGVKRDGPQSAPVHDARTMESTVPGVFIAGTAVAGSQQRFKTYIENSHVHAGRITAAILGLDPPAEQPARILPES